MAGHTYEFKVDGVAKTCSRFNVKKTLSPNPWAFDADFPGLPSGITSGKILEVYRDTYLYYKGKIIFCDAQYAPRQITISGRDITSHVLATRVYPWRREWSGEPATMVSDVCSSVSVYGDVTNYGSSLPIRNNWDTCADTVAKLTGMIGWETLVVPTSGLATNGLLRFKSQVGADKSASVTFESGVNCIIAKKNERRDQLFNRIYAKGKGSSDDNEILLPSPYYVQDQTSIDTYGLHSFQLIERDIYDATSLQKRAESFRNKHKDPWYVYEAKVKESITGDLLSRFEIGDTVKLISSPLGINGNYRINGLDLAWTPEGEVINVELAKLGLAFEDLAQQERSYLLGLYGPQIFSKTASNIDQTATNIDQTASNQDQTASNQNYGFNTASGYASGAGVSSVSCAAPTLAGGSWTVWQYEVYDTPTADQLFWIKISHSTVGTICQLYAFLKGSSSLRTIKGSFAKLGYNSGGTYTLSALDNNEAGMTMDNMWFYVWVWGEHTHPQNAHGHTQNVHGHNQNIHGHTQNIHVH